MLIKHEIFIFSNLKNIENVESISDTSVQSIFLIIFQSI